MPDDGHDIEPAALVEEPVLLEEMQGGESEPALFLRGDGFRGNAGRRALTSTKTTTSSSRAIRSISP